MPTPYGEGTSPAAHRTAEPRRSKAEHTAALRRDSRIVLVVNTRSRRAGRVQHQLVGLLAAAGVRLLADLPVTDPRTLPEVLGRALDLRPDMLVVAGGDGTLATAAKQLAYRDVALGVLPLGTTNNFARSLGLALGVRGAVRTVAGGRVADVDLGRIRGTGWEDLFANLASFGLSVQVAHRTPHLLKRRVGRAAYLATALSRMPGHRPFLATVTTSAGTQQFWTHQLNVANGRFHGGRAIARDASIDDRLLVAYRLGERRRWGLLRATASHVLHGSRRPLAATPFLVVPEVGVDTDPPLPVDVDGEVRGSTPVTISIAAQALRVVVPERFVDT
jgi:YegS/Rv2252/BmrU family lipid kinase